MKTGAANFAPGISIKCICMYKRTRSEKDNAARVGGRRMLLAALLMLSGAVAALAQNKVSGTVSDADGQPLVGVSIMEVGTGNGTVSDINGRYTLQTKSGASLRFTYLGYQPVTAKAAQGQSVVMHEDAKSLNEVVVVGYGTMRRKDVTSSITTIQSKDLNVGVMTNPAQMLQGKVPGLVVSTSSDPNSSPSIILRGASTLRTDGMEPYYIVDGVPGVDLSLVSADDIESIDILRDATATAIYGSKAANGVIIVTTKKGKKGAVHVSYSGYLALENVAKDLDLASASDLRSYASANGFELPGDEGASTDWQKEVERTGVSHSHNIAVNGGNNKSSYNVSLNYLNHQGVIRGTDMERLTARALAQSTVLKDRLTLSLGVNASQTTSNEVSTGTQGQSVTDAMIYYSPTQPIKNSDGTWFSSSSGATQNYNPLSMINEDLQKTIYKRMQITGKADLTILKGLVWSADFSYMDSQQTGNTYHSTKSQIVNTNGQATRNTYTSNKKVFETYLNYSKTFAEKHKLGLMAGYSWEETNSGDGFGVTVKNFYNDDVTYYNLTYANSMDGLDDVESGAESTLRMISFYGRANYSYNGRYNLQATLRRDGSSAFGKNNRWATFPSISASWRLSEESFIKSLNAFDNLNLRVGYGVSGNSLGFDEYIAIKTYGATGWYQYVDESGVTQTIHTLGAQSNTNENLKWERTGMFNIGLDFSFFNNRLSGTIEYYDKRTSDLIYYYPVSTNRYPYGTMTANVGDISNKGIELSLNAIPVRTKDFEWSATLNLSHNKNVVEKISNGEFSVNYIPEGDANIAGNSGVNVQRIMEGCPIGQFYLYEWAGYNDEGVSVFYEHDAETGERTGNKITNPTEKDQVKAGSAQPKLTYGWNNTLTYKRWGLNMFFHGVLGNKIFNALRAQYNSLTLVSQGKNVLKEALTSQKYGDVNAQYPSDRYLESGSYLRLSSLTLSYNFGNIGDWVSNLSVYATCNNVFTITGYKGTDPEIDLGGLTPGIQWRENYYPHTRTFMVGMKVNF